MLISGLPSIRKSPHEQVPTYLTLSDEAVRTRNKYIPFTWAARHIVRLPPVPTLPVFVDGRVFKLPARGILGRHAAFRPHVAQGRDIGSTYSQYYHHVLVLAWVRIRIHLYLPGAPCEIHHYRG